MCRAQKKKLTSEPEAEAEYFEDGSGARLEVRKELRTEAAGIRREIAAWTGGLPAAVPLRWPSAAHLLHTQDNMMTREVGGQPLYQWGQLTEPQPQPPSMTANFDKETLEMVKRIKAAPPREWPAPFVREGVKQAVLLFYSKKKRGKHSPKIRRYRKVITSLNAVYEDTDLFWKRQLTTTIWRFGSGGDNPCHGLSPPPPSAKPPEGGRKGI